MIRAKVLPKLLEQSHGEGIESSLLMCDDGSLLGTAGPLAAERSKDAHVVAAVLANVWTDYKSAGAAIKSGDLETVVADCEFGKIGVVKVGSKYIAAVCGKKVDNKVVHLALKKLHATLDPIATTYLESQPV